MAYVDGFVQLDAFTVEMANELVDAFRRASADDLLPKAYELARKITHNRSPVAAALTRHMMYRHSAAPDPLTAHQVDSLAMFYTSIGDGKEGVRAFLEKRDPKFTAHTSELPAAYPWWK